MLTIDLFEELEGPPEPNLIDALRDFLPIAVKHLKIKKLPKIKLLPDVDTEHLASFGKFSNEDRIVHVDINNRHPNDVLRTLAHELTHYAQGEQDRLDADSWRTGSTIEDEANAEAGVIMREFNKQFPQYMELKPIILPEAWSAKYKRSINCNNPKGFSQRAHCQGRKKHNESADYERDMQSDPSNPIPFPPGTTLVNVSDVYDWYKLGMAVPALDKADPRIFNKGVPHTVFAFGTEEEEHRMTPLLKRLGFTLHDIDRPEDYEKAIRASDVVEHLEQYVAEKWSKKYKKSINCSNPKGFSQKAHCAGRKKHTSEQLDENQEKYIIYLNDKPVSTYPTNREAEYQAKMVAQKFPTAKIDIKKEVCTLSPVQLAENLRDWFKKDKWVRMDTKGNIKGPCAREPGEGKPKCLPQAKAYALGKKGRAAAAQKKRREDPDPDRRGPAKNVATKVREQATRRDPKDLTAPTDQELDKLHHKFIPAWSMLDHDLLATAYDFQDDDTALSYVNQLDDVEQSMDHNAVITIDNARVSIKVRTGDIDGLSRLDFEFALRANDLAKQLQADQLPHATNAINEQQFDENCWKGYHKEGMKKMFGKTVPNCVKNESKESCPECGGAMYPESMLNEKQDACYYKVKSRYKVWPSAYASGALVQCRKKGAANWGNKSESIEENFADGKNPQDKGDSQRHGIPKGATIAQLEKAAKAPGRKGQLARWQINMRRGKKK